MRPNERITRLADLLAELPEVGKNVELQHCQVTLVGLVRSTSAAKYNIGDMQN